MVWKDFVSGNKQLKCTIVLNILEDILKAPPKSTIEEFRKKFPEYINVPTLEEWKDGKPLIGKDGFNVFFDVVEEA